MTRDSIDWNRLARYLDGETAPEESAEFRRWLEQHPSDAEVVRALTAATEGLSPSRAVDVENALRRVKARARAESRPPAWRVASLAAAAVIALAAGIFAWKRTTHDMQEATAFQTAEGVRDTVRLADGTTVYLAPASRLAVSGRRAELQGEAYFEVVHDPGDPFVVRVHGVEIRDVGTRFAVHGVAGEPVRVVVTEGAVAIARATDTVTLRPGDVAVVQADGIAASRGMASDDDLAWMQGRLVFRDAPLSRVAADLRRWYGVQLVVQDSALLRRHFTGSFVNESVDRVVNVIALALGARAQVHGDTATLSAPTPPR